MLLVASGDEPDLGDLSVDVVNSPSLVDAGVADLTESKTKSRFLNEPVSVFFVGLVFCEREILRKIRFC